MACALIAIAACTDGPTGVDSATLRIAIDLSPLMGGQQPGGRVSFVEDVVLTVTSAEGTSTPMTRTLAPTDSIATFDVTVDPGEVDFDVDVFSNAGVLIYSGGTTATIAANDFVVTIVITAVDAVMVVSPDTATGAQTGTPTQPFVSARLTVINAGSKTLTWSFDSAASGGDFSCQVGPRAICRNVALAPAASIAAHFFGPNPPGDYAVTFVSVQGTVVATVRVR